jgi:hypothetical protein
VPLCLWSDAVSELVVLRYVNVAIYCMLISSSLPLTSEIGHNIRFHHSNEGEASYEDKSGKT